MKILINHNIITDTQHPLQEINIGGYVDLF